MYLQCNKCRRIHEVAMPDMLTHFADCQQCKEITLHTPASFDAYVTQDYRMRSYRMRSTTAPATISVEYEEYSISPLTMVDILWQK